MDIGHLVLHTMDWCWNPNYKLSTFARGIGPENCIHCYWHAGMSLYIRAPTSLFVPWVFHRCGWDLTIDPPTPSLLNSPNNYDLKSHAIFLQLFCFVLFYCFIFFLFAPSSNVQGPILRCLCEQMKDKVKWKKDRSREIGSVSLARLDYFHYST